MKVEETKLAGCFIIHDTIYGDERGYFFESFNKQTFNQLTGLDSINVVFTRDSSL